MQAPHTHAVTTRHALTAPATLRAARRALLENGDAPEGLLDDTLARSWQRSRHAGLAPSGRMPGAPHASGAQLARALERHYELVAHARPVMEYMHPYLQGSASMIILADAQGTLLHTIGEDGFTSRAERVALRPGACWHEQFRGTNAIGTALAEVAPLVVHAGEHYLDRNGFLTCAAAPIVDPSGRLMGVIDISGDHRAYHPHTLGLASSAARMVEHRLFDTRHAGGLRLHLHAQAEGLGTLGEGLLALAEDGWVIGANSGALALLGLAREDIGAVRIEALLATDIDSLLDAAARGSAAPRTCARSDGTRLWLRLDAGRGSVNAAPRAARKPRSAEAVDATLHSGDALDALDTGDTTLREAAQKARRVQGKPIALLLQGESGVGKEVFARAVHASGVRRDAPFVAVNCAALPDTLIEAELFGYTPGAYTGARREGAPGRVREAHGGTLFLDEIGDMPLAMQARLLRVLQDRQVVPLGGGKPVPVDFALVCATHRKLRDEIAAGRFREDLYYRLNGLTLQLPALRERSDLDALVSRLLRELEPQRELVLSAELRTAFARYAWPGNLRQLSNLLRTACALLAEHEVEIGWAHLPDDMAEDLRALPRRESQPHGEAVDAARAAPADCERATDENGLTDLRALSSQAIERALAASQGNRSDAARRLGISRNTLYRKLRDLQAAP